MPEQKNEWKIGDELAIYRDGEYEIHKITGISETGRLTLGNSQYTINPDLSIRGLKRWSTVEYKAYIVTEIIRKQAERHIKTRKVTHIFQNQSATIFTNEELDLIIGCYQKALERAKQLHANISKSL